MYLALEYEGLRVFPQGHETWSNDMGPARSLVHMKDEPGWTITLFDVWALNRKAWSSTRTISWTPVDHDPVVPEVVAWCREHPTIAMSRFGQEALRREGIDAYYIPHAVEAELHPVESTLRSALDIPEDAYLVIINAANKGAVPARKAWPEMFAALARFQADRPDAYVYIHTDPSPFMGGLDLLSLAATAGLVEKRIRWADLFKLRNNLISLSGLAAMYSAGDVLLMPSMGEGFGIPAIEAQACGLPVIVSDFSAQPELVGAGWMVGGQRWWNASQGSYLFAPDIDDITAKLHAAYESRGDEGLRAAALAKAAEYDADKVYAEKWRPLMDVLAAQLDTRPRAERRAARRKKR